MSPPLVTKSLAIELQLRDQLLLPVVNKYQYISHTSTAMLPLPPPPLFISLSSTKNPFSLRPFAASLPHRAADVRACRGYKMLVRERTFLFALSSPLRPPTFTLVVSSLISSLISRGPRLTLKQTRTTVPFAALWQRGIPRLEKAHALRPISRLLSLSFCF